MTGDVLYIITQLRAKTAEKQSAKDVDVAKKTGRAGVDKSPDYLQSVKRDVNQAKNPLSLTAVKFGMHKSTD